MAGIGLSAPDAPEHTIAYISGTVDKICALAGEPDGISAE